MTTDIDRAEVFSRPAARFDEDGQLEIRASSSLGCRRALWYAATGCEPANPPSEDSLTAMEAGNALEPVVLRAMERAGWQVSPADPRNPESVSMRLRPSLVVTGHPDATGRMPLLQGETVSPYSNWTWYVTEWDPETGLCFGLVEGFEAEIGYFDLTELAEATVFGSVPAVDRDLYWKPMTLGEIRRAG